MESPHRNPSFTTDRPVAVLMVFLAAVVFGYFSLGQLPVTLMPEMSYPTLTVRTEYPGAAPEEVENDISRPIEEALGVVSGLNKISSISRAGGSDVVLEFVWGTPMVDAIQNTLEKLDLVYLPREAEKPLLLHYDPSLDPVMELSLSGSSSSIKYRGDEGLRRLRRIAELQVKRLIEPVKGVAAARVRGGLEEEIHVLIDEAKLQRVNLSIGQVLSRLRAENINAAGGRIREGGAEYMIRTINEYQTLEEIADTIVFRREGREIRVKDLGQVVHGQRDREMLTHTDGAESVQIDIYKEADANMVAVAKRVIALIGEVPVYGKEKEDKTKSKRELQREKMKNFSRAPTLAGKLFNEEQAKLRVVADRSVFIDNSIQEVLNTAIAGGPARRDRVAAVLPARHPHDGDHRAEHPDLDPRDVRAAESSSACRSTSCRSVAWRWASACWWTRRSWSSSPSTAVARRATPPATPPSEGRRKCGARSLPRR